jgi:ketosteroid isomerase-like protein
VHDVFGNDEHVVGLQRVSAQRSGKSYETTEVIVFHVAGGLITEAWEHPFNMYEQDELFA